MSKDNRPGDSHEPEIASLDDLRRRREDDRVLVREALERATDGIEPRIDTLLDAVPRMLAEAGQRRARHSRRDAITASVPLARTAIPGLTAAAALLVAISVALLLGGSGTESTSGSIEEMLVAGNGVTDEMILGTMFEEEESP